MACVIAGQKSAGPFYRLDGYSFADRTTTDGSADYNGPVLKYIQEHSTSVTLINIA
jgi:hypothetical protein